MSPPIWTSAESWLRSSPFSGEVWRIVEEDAPGDQSAEGRFFHHLLCDPFRPRDYRDGSRFRRAGVTPGVWYGAEASKTAAIEKAFHRFSDHVKPPSVPVRYVAFSVDVKTEVAFDLTEGAIADAKNLWDSVNYKPCQDLAEVLCKRKCEIIRYASLRDKGGVNIAVLSCCAFASHVWTNYEPWNIEYESSRAHFSRAGEEFELAFPQDFIWRGEADKPTEK